MASNKVEALRKARGWTRMELAEKVSMSHSAVTKIERGERRIPDDRAREFARVFGVSAGEVIEGVDELQRVPIIDVAALPAVAYGAERPTVDRTVTVQSTESGLVAIEYEGDVMFSTQQLAAKVREKTARMPGLITLILNPSDRETDGLYVVTRGTQIEVAQSDELSDKVRPLAKIIQVIGTT